MSKAFANRKLIKHYHEPGDFHELTFTCYRRRPLLTNDDWRTRLSRSINDAIAEAAFELVGFVYMPEHVHLLVYPTLPEPDIGRFLARVKQPFSKQIKEILIANRSPLLNRLTVQERPGKICFRFWQEGPGCDRNIYSPEAVEASLNYIHNNPCKRGLCERATDWIWSSARYYLLTPPKQQFPELPFLHGIPWGAFDRDARR
ncbi:MAG: transposase [Pirellulaceae bacterium]